ncbi:caspase-like [Nylanderia fulva]|uniref:caspase-like n=1 Tax=Nylanderia fulva TaxID=613905 RepID=UPI0010FAD843|nr:caspase-like [Nylanderia fulva]
MGHSLMHPPYREPGHRRSTVSRSFYSWRNPDVGSWFIQALCEELDLHGRRRDLLSLMTFVNRRVAIEYQSYVPQNEKFHGKKQIPSIVSMLTRLVYFRDKCASIPEDKEEKSQACEKIT